MQSADREALASAVRSLDTERRTDFLAALWAARGRDVRRVGPARLELDGGRVMAATPGGAPDPDLVVVLGDEKAPAAAPEVTVIDGARLGQIAAYSIDRETLTELCETFFETPPEALAEHQRTPRVGLPDVSGIASGRRRGRLGMVAVAVAVLVASLVVGGVAERPLNPSGSTADAVGSVAADVSVPGMSAAPATATLTPAPTAPPTDRPSGRTGLTDPDALPPGVAPDGDIDEQRLAAAHTAFLENRSYRVTLTYREFVDGRPAAVRRERIRVNGTGYRARIREVGAFRTDPTAMIDREVGTNGTAVVSGRLVDGPDGFRGQGAAVLDDQARLIGYYLSVRRSAVVDSTTVDGERAYWLTTDGDSWPGVVDATGSALVTRSGVVRELRRSYDDPNRPGVSVLVTLRVEQIGTAGAEPGGNRTTSVTTADGGSRP